MKKPDRWIASESEIQKAIIDYLRLKGWMVIKFSNVGIFKKATGQYIPPRQKGVADLLCFKMGKSPLAVEVKSEKGIVSAWQEKWGNEFVASGGRYIVARSLDELVKKL